MSNGVRLRAIGGLMFLAALLTTADTGTADEPSYRTAGHCDGLPRVDLQTALGYCVGLVRDDLFFPRGIAVLKDGRVLVVDMGGWNRNRGSVWLLQRRGNSFSKRKLLGRLDRPHGIGIGPDGKAYVGVIGGVIRFHPDDPQRTREQIIGGSSGIEGPPGTGRHPLTSLLFTAEADLLINVGSQTDNCEGPDNSMPDYSQPCAEAEGVRAQGVLRRYHLAWPEGQVQGWQVFAHGLRNSLALAADWDSGVILQGENARDAINERIPDMADDEDTPHDELNLLTAGANYGWPYCYDDGKSSPEFAGTNCAPFRSPYLLLPAHAAPLSMTYYRVSASRPRYLAIAYHGYRANGHRVVAFEVDETGLPKSKQIELIGGWEESRTHPQGTPAGIAAGPDGALYITEDVNGTVLRLVPTH